MIGAIILGLLAGFIAKALMPGKDPGGFFVTLLLGLAGSVDLGGLIGAIIGTMILLGIWRVIDGRRNDRTRTSRPATR